MLDELTRGVMTVKALTACHMLSPKRQGRSMINTYIRLWRQKAKERPGGEAASLNLSDGLDMVMTNLRYAIHGQASLTDDEVLIHGNRLMGELHDDRPALIERLEAIQKARGILTGRESASPRTVAEGPFP